MEQSPDGKMRGRRRWRGRSKRGRQSIADLDHQDGTDARRSLEIGLKLLALFHTDEVKALPKAQRDDKRDAGIDYLQQCQRWLD